MLWCLLLGIISMMWLWWDRMWCEYTQFQKRFVYMYITWSSRRVQVELFFCKCHYSQNVPSPFLSCTSSCFFSQRHHHHHHLQISIHILIPLSMFITYMTQERNYIIPKCFYTLLSQKFCTHRRASNVVIMQVSKRIKTREMSYEDLM